MKVKTDVKAGGKEGRPLPPTPVKTVTGPPKVRPYDPKRAARKIPDVSREWMYVHKGWNQLHNAK
ncbi:MAG: hypothetical protein BWK80_25930 [Desulfobacteraceae bacterium IS3]|nr:MAG: hypothetical protein BWK80_25930 [Desulfobacteraceae bacterium IS3]HAO19180.1 hypothetical protein [Desulfobacteraceae bacterium]